MIEKAGIEDAASFANLHYKTITEGFLSKLGLSFLKSLYSFLVKTELVLVYKKEERILGFVSCSINSEDMMKRFVFLNPAGLLKILWRLVRKPSIIIPLFETYCAPVKSKNTSEKQILPVTELLSISVDTSAQKGNIGTQLLYSLEEELRNRGIKKYKVVAGESLIGANKFYLKNGFVLATRIAIHGDSLSNVYTKEL